MKQKNQTRKLIGTLTFVIIGAVVGFFIGKMAASDVSSSILPAWVKISMIGLLVPAFLVAIGIHEGGHAVAGVNVGFDFKMYIVGPFMWEKDTTGWHFKWNKNVNTAGGMVMCLPTDTVDLPRRFSIFAAGGPLASLILAVVAYGIYALGFKESTEIDLIKELVGSFIVFTAIFSIFFFFITSIPLHMGGFYTDGARVLRLLRGGDRAKFDCFILKFVTQSSSGIRPKLLNVNEIEETLAIGQRINETFTVYLHSYLYQVALDKGEVEKAEKHLLDYIGEAENIPDGIRNGVWQEAAFFYAYAKKDLTEAEKFWQQFKPTAMLSKAQISATEAAIEILRNNKEVALAKIEAAEKEIPNMIDKGLGVALKEKLEILKSEYLLSPPTPKGGVALGKC
jgi:hypothetical protein